MGTYPSQDNPADIVSHGCFAAALKSSALWQCGPTWICNQSSWPQWPKSPATSTAVLSTVAAQLLPTPGSSICRLIDLNRFNSYSHLLAISVYVYHFCYRTGVTGPLTTSELDLLECIWLQSEQIRSYPQVISYLSTPSKRHQTSVPPLVRQLDLFLSEDGLICTKGCSAPDSSLILLPRHSRFTELLILDCHLRMRHIGVGGTIVMLRDRFWVPSAHAITRRLLPQGATCRKVTGHHYSLPQSPELPKVRQDTSAHPFSNISVDFTGHLIVKDRSGNPITVYICLFTYYKSY